MARITNIKSGVARSTTKNLPRIFDKDHRIRRIGGNSPEVYDNSVCNGIVSCTTGLEDPRAIEVECDSSP